MDNLQSLFTPAENWERLESYNLMKRRPGRALLKCLRCLMFSVQWHRTATTQETDGFQVKRPGDVGVRCTVLLMLDYQVGRSRQPKPDWRNF